MALINQNSIIGITSITSPSASNVLTVHTNDTTERLRVSTSGLSFSGTNASLDTSGNISAVDGTFTGNVSIGGTLTYEDVTNIDSVGIITAQAGIRVTGGLVGIGTDSPVSILHLNSSVPRFTLSDTGTNAHHRINADSSVGNFGFEVDYDSATSTPAFFIKIKGDEKLRITSDGKIGINQSTPQTTFHSTGTTNGQQATFGIDNSGLKISTFQKTDNDAGVILDAQKSSNGTLTFATAGTERLRINANGSIRLTTEGSTANPNAKIDTSGDYLRLMTMKDGSGGCGLKIETQHSGSVGERLRITSGGDVNIGPSANANGHGLLTLSQSAAAAFNALVIQQGNTAFTATDGLQIGIDAGVHAYIKQYENRDIYFTTGNPNTEKLRITSSGRVLAGLTASVDSNSTLQVEGRNTITAIRYSAATGNAGSKLELSRSASNTVGTTAAVSATDELGEIRFRGASTGSAFNTGAVISAVITSGTISASSFPTDLLFKTTNNGAASATEKLRITSAGQLSIGSGNNNLQGQVTIFEGTDFNSASQGGRDNIYLISDRTSGNGQYGSSIAWSRIQYPDRRAAAIVNVQTTADEDQVGLAFFTHPSTNASDAIVEKLRITHDGQFEMNGVRNIYQSFLLENNQTYNWDFTVPSEGGYGNSFYLVAGYNHYYTANYGAHRTCWFSSRGTSVNFMGNGISQTSGNAGYWDVSKPNSTTVRITKTNGTYGGSGYGFFHLTYNHF